MELDSLNVNALRLHGQLMLLLNRPSAAETDFRRLMTTEPSDPWGPAGMGEIMTMKECHKEAAELLAKALALEESSDFRISLIGAQLKSNQLSQAESTINESVRLYPTQPEFYLLRAIFHLTMHQNQDAELDKNLAKQYGLEPQLIEKYIQNFLK